VSKPCRTEGGDGEAEIQVIKKIDKFTAYFYSALLVNRDHLEKAEVHVLEPGAVKFLGGRFPNV
jgi:hypothetical protein